MTQMKPQFDEELAIGADGNIEVSGPIDLSGTETLVGVWVMLTQGETVGDSAGMLSDVGARVAEGEQRLHDALSQARKGTTALSADEARAAVAEGTPRWGATVKAARGQFQPGKARAQASVTVQDGPNADKSPGMWLSVTWTEEVTLIQ